MAELNLPGQPEIRVHLRRSAKARKLSLRISSLDGRVTLTLPSRVPEREGRAFLEEKADWIRGHLQKQPAIVYLAPGGTLPVAGQIVRIEVGTGRRVIWEGDHITLPKQAPIRRLERFLREMARERLVAASDHYAERLGRPYRRITLRDTRSRWGSCTGDGALMYSWRLILAPPRVLRYVAAHEVAHLHEMNHSKAFWATVDDLFGDCRSERRWLREEGNTLHRFRFDAAPESEATDSN